MKLDAALGVLAWPKVAMLLLCVAFPSIVTALPRALGF